MISGLGELSDFKSFGLSFEFKIWTKPFRPYDQASLITIKIVNASNRWSPAFIANSNEANEAH